MTSLHSLRPVSGRPADLPFRSTTAPTRREGPHRPILVHSPLRWGPGAERPRQVFSRLAAHHPVMYVESPMHAALDGVSLQLTEPHPNVVRVVPLLPLDMQGNEDERRAAIAQALQAMLAPSSHDGRDFDLKLYGAMARGGPARPTPVAGGLSDRFQGAIQWFCSPMDAPIFIGRFGTLGVVYDRAGALATPLRQAAEFDERDRSLIRQADLVFQEIEAQSVARRMSAKAPPESREAQARRAAWDAVAASMRARLLMLDPVPGVGPLPASFLAASVVALGLN